jgi:hypothetical protein
MVEERAFLIGGGGLFAVLGSSIVGYSGAGPLGCIVAAFVASYGWKLQGWSSSFVSSYIDTKWSITKVTYFTIC